MYRVTFVFSRTVRLLKKALEQILNLLDIWKRIVGRIMNICFGQESTTSQLVRRVFRVSFGHPHPKRNPTSVHQNIL